MRRPAFQGWTGFLGAGLFFALLSWPGPAGAFQDKLEPTRERLDTLRKCLWPAGNAAVDSLRQGLLGWHNQTGSDQPGTGGLGATGRQQSADPIDSLRAQFINPPPREYLDSLDQDIRACTFAQKSQDKALRQDVMSSVIRDINLKSDDCRKFGMGRKVPVHVSTLRGSAEDHGWAVFYKWSGASSFQGDEVRSPHLTSPANLDLPPGEYSIRAGKKLPGGLVVRVDPVKVIVGMKSAIDLQLPIQ
jgi:hypothetical protein